ncbi:uncharacterized protein LOC114743859 [Neltuma alba]|uniref:uncharacterized protein LOC114743859 n=1 Tax=Neltuma alba TaxID=207710 RepID=UPI0010A2C009|nr:uncharacterized protein LOC114743859 [Prosopis alba]
MTDHMMVRFQEISKLYKLPDVVKLSKEDVETMFPRLSMIEPRILEKSKQPLLVSVHILRSLHSLWFRYNEELIAFQMGRFKPFLSIPAPLFWDSLSVADLSSLWPLKVVCV